MSETPAGEHSADKDGLHCRACYAATLTKDELERFNAEPVTSCIYYCPEHQRVWDRALKDLPQLPIILASTAAYAFPTMPEFEVADEYECCASGRCEVCSPGYAETYVFPSAETAEGSSDE